MNESYMTFWLAIAAVFLVALALILGELRRGRTTTAATETLHLCDFCGWVGTKPQHDLPYKEGEIACCHDAAPVK